MSDLRRLALVSSPAKPAFEEMFAREYAFVFRSLRHLGVAEAALDDAAQDVFVVVHRRWADYEPARDSRGWLWGIARRVARGHLRGEHRYRRKLALVDSVGVDRSLEGQLERADAAAFVDEFLSRLPLRLREVFVLADIEGLTAAEVALALNVALNTVYSRQRVGRQRFAKAIEKRRLRLRREETNHG